MKTPFNRPTPHFDAQAIHQTIRSALAAAGLDTTSGPMLGVTETIRRALSAAGLPTSEAAAGAHADVIDVVAGQKVGTVNIGQQASGIAFWKVVR